MPSFVKMLLNEITTPFCTTLWTILLTCLFSVGDHLDGKTKERCGLGRINMGKNFFNYFNDSLAQVRKRNKRASEGEYFLSQPFDR